MNSDIINILTRPLEHEWSVQGLGMMRTYLDETRRLHIWHTSLMVHGATPLHDHPWNFKSEVVFGMVKQNIYTIVKDFPFPVKNWTKQRILCGEGGDVVGDSEQVLLRVGPLELYPTGHVYHQQAHEIHNSFPSNNTVTVVTRDYLEDRDHAYVYIPEGGEFVSAAPRPASHAEILFITREVLHAYQES